MQCTYIKSDQVQCNAHAIRDSSLCFNHNENFIEAKHIAVTKGGKAPKKNYDPLPIIEINDSKSIVNLLGQTINEVRLGAVNLRVATVTGYLASILLRAIETAEVEERITEIEKNIINKLL